tara:strand:+ start:9327 stop:9551 length:225 start_codon:yes stop_codon:yes gene_type:complete
MKLTGDSIDEVEVLVFKREFIYNALVNGWSVKMIKPNTFEFFNKDTEIRKQYTAKNFLNEFVKSNFNMDDACGH